MPTQFCPICGAQNTDVARFCQQCGASLVPGAQAPPPATPFRTLALQHLLHERYIIIKQLGQGGMGAVYLAQDIQLFDRLCVVKEMLPYYATPQEQQEAEDRFRREAQLLANLRHPGIPQIYEYFVEQDRYYLVMEFIEGENLEKRWERISGPLPEQEVLECARQLADVLVYIARQSPPVIHRDIKPANIICDEATGRVKLVDFGLAKAQSAAPGTKSTPLGTPGYTPPEQYQGRTEPRSDVFALGATLHHMVTGRDPREAPLLFDYPPACTLVPALSPEVEALLQRMLANEPAQRPTAAQLQAELAALGQGKGKPVTGPFTFRSGATAQTVQDLGLLCDHHWADGVFHLYQGHFEPWLQSINRYDLASAAQTIRQRASDPNVGLEEFLRSVNPTVPLPVLTVAHTALDFGTVEKGEQRTLDLEINNTGRGYLHGQITSLVPWLKVKPGTVGCMAGDRQRIQVTLDSSGLSEGRHDAPVLEITTNGGQQRVTAGLLITWQPHLAVRPARLEFGEVLVEEHGRQVASDLTLRNDGGGLLEGQLSCIEPWLTLSYSQFCLPSGQEVTVTVWADTGQIPALRSQTMTIAATLATGDTLAIPAHIGIKKAWYSPASRAGRWAAYGLFALLGVLGWAYATTIAVQVLLDGLRNDMRSALLFLVLPLLALLPFELARRLISPLDEIEAYYCGGDLAGETSRLTFSAARAWNATALTAAAGLMVGLRYSALASGSVLGWPTLIGLLAGAVVGWLLMSGARVHKLRFRVLIVGLAMALLGRMMSSPTRGGLMVWALAGLGLAVILNPVKLPLRLRWLLSQAQQAAVVLVLACAGSSLAQALTARYVWPPLLPYGHLPGLNLLGALRNLVILVGGAGGALLGLWSDPTAGADWRTTWRGFVALACIGIVVGLLASGVGWIVFTLFTLGHTWGPGIAAIVTVSVGAIAWASLRSSAKIEQAIAKVRSWVAAQWGRVSLPAAIARWQARISSRVPLLPTSGWLSGLTPAIAVSTVVILVLLMPFVVHFVLSALIVLACLAVLVVPR